VKIVEKSGGYAQYTFIADFYDFVPLYVARNDIRFYLEAARQNPGNILELGCGTGRILIPIAKAGISITGLDLSEPMLFVCRNKLASESAEVRSRANILKADMRNFKLDQKFSLVTIPFRAFQHLLTIEDQLACLKCVHDHLNDNGHLILDLFNPSLKFLINDRTKEKTGAETEFTLTDGRKALRKTRVLSIDLCNQQMDCEMIYYVKHPDGRDERLVHRFDIRYFFRFEAEHLLERACFDVEALYGDYEKNIFDTNHSNELIFVAKKR
jgi:SAM-dependent methyltransferase